MNESKEQHRQVEADLQGQQHPWSSPGPGSLVEAITKSYAEFESAALAERIEQGKLRKVQAGGTVGRAPIGYQNTCVIENGQHRRSVDVDPERGRLIRWAFSCGANAEWDTVRELLAEVTRLGWRGRPRSGRPAQPLTTSGLLRILHNPYYMGQMSYRGQSYQGTHEPLIDEATWNIVQRRLAHSVNSPNKRETRDPEAA